MLLLLFLLFPEVFASADRHPFVLRFCQFGKDAYLPSIQPAAVASISTIPVENKSGKEATLVVAPSPDLAAT
jgi:hypothetical protein